MTLNTRNFFFLIAIPLFMAIPAIAMLLLYYFTENPQLRPLGITKQEIAVFEGQGKALAIKIDVDWGQDRTSGITKVELQNRIANTMSFRTDDFDFRFNDVPGEDVAITFSVSHNRYGPYAPNDIIEGIRTSLIALQAVQRARKLPSTIGAW